MFSDLEIGDVSYHVKQYMDKFGHLTVDEMVEPLYLPHRITYGATLFESNLESLKNKILMTRPWSLYGVYRQLGVQSTKEFKKTSHSQKEAKTSVLNNSVYHEKRRNTHHQQNLLKTNNQQRRSYGLRPR